jgi:hypothetical protein
MISLLEIVCCEFEGDFRECHGGLIILDGKRRDFGGHGSVGGYAV